MSKDIGKFPKVIHVHPIYRKEERKSQNSIFQQQRTFPTSMYEPVSSDGTAYVSRYTCPPTRSDHYSETSSSASSAADGGACETHRHNATTTTRRPLRPSMDSLDNCMGGDNCIDVEQIKLERHRLKCKHQATQTTHLTPYRLRFWPLAASGNLKCVEANFVDIAKCCLKTLSQWFLSQVGLTVILVFWALLGAAAFYKTEGPREREQAEDLARLKSETAVDLATDLRQLQGYDGWTKVIEKYLDKHEKLLLEAVSAGYGEGGVGSIWTYPGCILFAVSLLTTLGFGAPVPRTPLGRGTAVLFSAIGIPLHFLLILNIGNLAARTLSNLATIRLKTDVPDHATSNTKKRKWYKWFPLVAIAIYYTMGVILFGVVRNRPVVDCLMFPLDFTAAGGVAKTSGHVRILYGLYLEFAVMLAAVIASMLQASASRGVIDLGLRLGLLTNT